jgi:mannose-6-phosphate isomerase-like protein (cupin superfamily)
MKNLRLYECGTGASGDLNGRTHCMLMSAILTDVPAVSRISTRAKGELSMPLATHTRHVAYAAIIGIVALTADSSLLAQTGEQTAVNPSTSSSAGLILQESEGEVRVRRPRGNSGADGAPSFIIKVDRKYGESPTFFMGMENIPPGKRIRLHHHPHAEEILFVHRGTGVVRLGSRETEVKAGATVYIPRNVSVGLRNTGTEPLSLIFVFPESDGMSGQMRSGSVPLGEEPKPFTPEELAARNARASEHIVFDEPAAQ